MKAIKITGAAVLSLLIGIAVPVYPQQEHEEKQDHPQQQGGHQQGGHEQGKPEQQHAQTQHQPEQKQQQPAATLANSCIMGTATIGGTNTVEINAVPVAP